VRLDTRIGSVLVVKAKTVPALGEALPLGPMAAVAVVGLSRAEAVVVAALTASRSVVTVRCPAVVRPLRCRRLQVRWWGLMTEQQTYSVRWPTKASSDGSSESNASFWGAW